MYEVLIPAYKSDAKLVDLIAKLLKENLSVTVVDNGGGAEFSALIKQCKQLGVHVVVHTVNQGKGCTIKSRYNEILMRPDAATIKGIVTADAIMYTA